VPSLTPLITADRLQSRCDELAAEIAAAYGDEPLVLIAVLKGSFQFVSDLARRLPGPVMVDFVQLSSYGQDKSSSGIVQVKKDHDVNIEGRHVLVVEDIVDTGLTLKYLLEVLQTRRPKSLKVATMLSKPTARRHEALVDYVGFEIENKFVVGYGLDHAESYRNLPYVAVLGD
jgi:hypoxanthine phosphoribosyltransferase